MIKKVLFFIPLILFLLTNTFVKNDSHAKSHSKKAYSKKAKKKKSPKKVTVPINIGMGPSFNTFTGLLDSDQIYHYGLKLDLYAYIDKALLKKAKHKIPKKFRKMALKMDSIKYRPSILIPNHLFISPKTKNTGVFGASWRPISTGFALIKTSVLDLDLNAGPIITYAFMTSDNNKIEETINFFRPGIDINAELYIKFSRWFLISGGWTSAFYIPQRIDRGNGSFLKTGSPSDQNCIWHIGTAFAMMHFRIPYSTRF